MRDTMAVFVVLDHDCRRMERQVLMAVALLVASRDEL